jgi:hypothetical protein
MMIPAFPPRLLVVATIIASAAGAIAGELSFKKDVAPLLQAKCLRCHSGTRPKGDLDLSREEGLRAGGSDGAVVQPGKANASLLYQYIVDKKMPPKEPLAAADIEILRRWIDAGAIWEGPALAKGSSNAGISADWWSLKPIQRPTVPAVKNRDWVRNPVDAFILARLDAAGLSPTADADRLTYIRRVSLDLIGLPPTPAEVDAFLLDRSADADEKLVDRLLASPHYGERWGRHWLDVVRFGESHGYEMNTLRPNAWPYRDYVIRAFNGDRPFPRFVLEQLAGDAVAGSDLTVAAGTGFLVGGTHDLVGNATREGQLQQRSDDLYDMVSTTGSAFLGMTVNCARCHDHKFDPILQRDFYALEAVFAGIQHAERPFPGAGKQKLLVYAGTFRQPDATHRLQRGDPMQPLEAVTPAAILSIAPALALKADVPEQQRRVALAGWIGDRRNPLPARVMVNRLWHYHFGQGIVRTPSDFGRNGDQPSHPELLDWLAAEYQANGWRLKPLHRLIALSRTYRQSATAASTSRDGRMVDAGCRLLWRFPARRLEAEAIRDAMLQVSGCLNPRMGGPGYNLWQYSGYVIVFNPKEHLGRDEFRRMVYQFKPRTQQDAVFGAFDCPDATQTMARRNVSTTALQALNLLNSTFVLDQSDRFASRLSSEAGTDPHRQVERAFRLAFGRAPTNQEAAAAERLVREDGLPLLCRALFNANEFVFGP